MPETAMNETDGPEARENHIRFARQRRAVKSIPDPTRVQCAA
jgi:hypothetical protein